LQPFCIPLQEHNWLHQQHAMPSGELRGHVDP
jgi:hypothetical protein